ncbi:MAG: YifB family Mg chelatase-like AAA ATPase [Pseudomonadota bacterium]
MLSRVLSSALLGVDSYIVEVEVDITQGLPSFSTVGLPETAVKESKDRVKAAIHNSGYHFSDDRITVNLAPADIKKEGTGFDLPIAIGILSATNIIPHPPLSEYLLIGELSLDGRVKPVKGALSVALAAKANGLRGIVVPKDNALEAAVVQGIDVLSAETLSQVVEHFRGVLTMERKTVDIDSLFNPAECSGVDFNEVKGQEHAKRALEIAAAGGHNVLMLGPPGSGKTMLARRLSTILPSIGFDEALETTKIFSVMGLLDKDQSLIMTRPFRSPHHTISDAGLIGGGQSPKPGEVSLAHNGVLFLDELPEFRKNVLEVLRQPMEDGNVTISRASASITYPARFMLIAAMNPCPCGYFADPNHQCTCTNRQIQRYRTKVSGPLLDRIDLQIEVPAVKYKELADRGESESSLEIQKRVERARGIQAERFRRLKVHCNAQMEARHIKKHCNIGSDSHALLEKAIDRLGLSARAYNRILKISRTIADLEDAFDILIHHISEAVQYRNFDRNKHLL